MFVKKRKRLTIVIIASVLLLILAVININFGFITVPKKENMASRQIDFITISTVFAGFSFTALGLLLGLSSEKLIEKVKNTSIISDKVNRIITSIIFFILSVIVSLYFVLGLNDSIFDILSIYEAANKVVYVMGIGYLILGIGYFVYSVYELYDLIKRVYSFNKNSSSKQIEKAKEELENNRKNLREANFEEE
jgi:peptidoglycan/LPS O-acetylase OafA/YrhL